MNDTNKKILRLIEKITPTKRVYALPSKEDDIYKVRNEGDVWFETSNGIEYKWEIKNGIKIKTVSNLDGIFDNIRFKFFNCPKDQCTCTNPTRLDEKFRFKTGMCSDCVISKETMLKIKGNYKEYENSKLKDNINAWIRDAERDKEALKENLKKTEFVHDNGFVEKWTTQNLDDTLRGIDEAFEEFIKNLWENYGIRDEESIN